MNKDGTKMVLCPVCKNTCINPYGPGKCRCCDGVGEISLKKSKIFVRVRKDINKRLRKDLNGE